MKFLSRRNVPSAMSLALIMLMSNSAMAQTPTKTSDTAVAKLGTLQISSAEVQQLLRAMPESERAKVKSNREGLDNWLRQRLASEALLREAQQKKWAERPEVKTRIDAAIKDVTARIVSNSYLESIARLPADFPNDADISTAYERAKPQLNIAATYRVAQIFLPIAPDADAATIAAVRKKAAELAKQAREGDFAALAKAHSQDTLSAAKGGEVGNLPLAQLLPETRDVVAGMQLNQVSEPVRSASGFHVLKLLASQASRPATLEEVKPTLQTALREQRQRELANEYLGKLAPASDVKIDNAALDAALQKIN
ncbi:peptidylprolyl isomerase [Comamonas sp. lk]|uniref:peptidylprolyl isomerase n=1 Tax=Comamonas sp. lk TaxID=2201272 RepID=UPI001F08BE91|nr:peptidylprolyl isomerase [Comamonas sp. lk]